jgi:hypothetical protein
MIHFVTRCVLGQEPDDWWSVEDGRDLPKTERTVWTAGGTAKVAFSMLYNHGGLYSYRLCPAEAEQTEQCFQNMHLSFADDVSIVYWTPDRNGNIDQATFPAVTMSEGTFPLGSQVGHFKTPTVQFFAFLAWVFPCVFYA